MQRIFHGLILLGLLAMLTACGASRKQVPVEFQAQPEIPGFTSIRYFGDEPPEDIEKMLARWSRQTKRGGGLKQFSVLSLSGGGADGAFGAGFLVGWTAQGDRPDFHFVTGVSTGALIAPFAFAGPKYDPLIEKLYTTFSTEMLAVPSLLVDGLYDTEPFRETLKKYITRELVDDIGKAHRNGRRLLIGTTNLDAMRPVYWNIGAIAQYPSEVAVQLIRDVMLASASVPVAFPPVYIKVRVNDVEYDEMHVDGGVTNQLFTYPTGLHMDQALASAGFTQEVQLYVIRNDSMNSRGSKVEPNLLDIASRSMDGLIRNQGIGDLYRIYYTAKRDGLNFNLAYIPPSWDEESNELFDPVYMKKLFKVGYDTARSSRPWHKSPPENLGPKQ